MTCYSRKLPVWPEIDFCKNRFYGQRSPIACHTFLESSDTQLSFGLSGNHFSASYEAPEFCWQIGLNFLQHLRTCHICICFSVQSYFTILYTRNQNHICLNYYMIGLHIDEQWKVENINIQLNVFQLTSCK